MNDTEIRDTVLAEYEEVDLPDHTVEFIASVASFYEDAGYVTDSQMDRLREIYDEYWE